MTNPNARPPRFTLRPTGVPEVVAQRRGDTLTVYVPHDLIAPECARQLEAVIQQALAAQED